MSKLEEFKRKKAAQKKVQNATFLKEFAEQESVQSLEGGIAYEVLREGKGRVSPSVKDWVTCHYHGTLIDGKVFDSSLEKSKPATFKLNNLIKAWQIILPEMVVGDRWKVVVPPELGYGERQEGKIPSNSVLIFEIELLAIGK